MSLLPGLTQKSLQHRRASSPSLEITDLKGKAVQLPGTGSYRLINYWATWCGPCLNEMPLLDKFSQSKTGNSVLVIGIALDEAEDVNQYLKENPLKYTQFLEKAGKNDSSTQLGNKTGIIPFSILISLNSISHYWSNLNNPDFNLTASLGSRSERAYYFFSPYFFSHQTNRFFDYQYSSFIENYLDKYISNTSE